MAQPEDVAASQQRWADIYAADLVGHDSYLYPPDKGRLQEDYREASTRAASETSQPADWPLTD